MNAFQDAVLTADENIKEFVQRVKPVAEMFRALQVRIGREKAIEAVGEAGEALGNAGGSIVEDVNEFHILAMHSALIRYVSEKTSREVLAVFLKTKDQAVKKAV